MIVKKAQFVQSLSAFREFPGQGLPEIAMVGKSNVGKSSLINKFFNRKNLARVSGVPGKTTTVNFFRCDGVRIADLPGYGYAKRSDAERRRWGELMEGYFAMGRDIRLIVQLLDMRHDPTADDRTMLRFLADSGYPFLCVLTKCDKLNKTERTARREAFAADPDLAAAKAVIEASAVSGEGMEELKTAVEAALSLLKTGGVLVICAYPGHPEGDRERSALTEYLSALPPQRFNVLHHRFLNAGPGAPECFAVQKQKQE